MNKYRKPISTMLLIGLIGSFSFLIFNNSDGPKIAKKENNGLHNEGQIVSVAKEFATANGLDDMVSNSDLIVIGKYGDLDKIWNMSGNPENKSEYVEGHLYNFTVSEVLKGDKVKDIRINHRYSESIPIEITSGDEEISPEGILIKEPTSSEEFIIENKDPLFIEPDSSKRYIVFLKKGYAGDYYPAIEPYLIEIDKSDTILLKSNLINLDESDLSTITKVNGHEIVVNNDIHRNISDDITGKTYSDIKKDIIKIINHSN